MEMRDGKVEKAERVTGAREEIIFHWEEGLWKLSVFNSAAARGDFCVCVLLT